jgi:hypothetical protein
VLRLNLRKINQLIREAWNKGQREALRGAGKSSCYSWSLQVARDYFPDIDPTLAARIAQGKARLHWDDGKREIIVVSTAPDEARPPFEQRQSEDRLQLSGERPPVTLVDLDDKETP